MQHLRSVAGVLFALAVTACGEPPAPRQPMATAALTAILDAAERIPNRTGWFEVLRLPNDVYALWEPGHVERVNAFFVPGGERDLLYDTGMGIASVTHVLDDIRRVEGLTVKPLQVVNSHNHLDHNGGNKEFDEIWTADDDWARRRLSLGVPAGTFVEYWDQLTNHPGASAPPGFDPATHAIPPYPLGRVRYLSENDEIDLGGRRFRVVRTFSHSPDGIALYDSEHGLFFGGDAFYGADYLVTDLALLAADLERTRNLAITWHYSSHGPQLVAAMRHGAHLAVVRRLLAGEGETHSARFAGVELPVRELDGVTVTLAPELLLY